MKKLFKYLFILTLLAPEISFSMEQEFNINIKKREAKTKKDFKGLMFLNGNNKEQTLEFIREKSDVDRDPDMQYRNSMFYYFGIGQEQNFLKAFHYCNMARKQNILDARIFFEEILMPEALDIIAGNLEEKHIEFEGEIPKPDPELREGPRISEQLRRELYG